jgi:HTH-type transcriptional regulator/antitoxin HigA
MLKPIENRVQYEDALARVYSLMQKDLKPESMDSDELEMLFILVKEYELVHYPMSNLSPL